MPLSSRFGVLAASAVLGGCIALLACSQFTAAPATLADAGGDASANDGAGVPFCTALSPQPTFCDDFERTDVLGGWTNRSTSGGGLVETATATSSAGRELHAFQPLFTSGGAGQAALTLSAKAAGEITFAFRLRIDAPPSEGAVQTMAVFVEQETSADFANVFLIVRPDGVALSQQTFPHGGAATGEYREQPLGAAFSFGVMQSVEMHLTLVAPPRVRLSVGGKDAFEGPLFEAFRPGLPTFYAGINFVDAPAGPLSLRIDDVVVTVK